MERIRELTQLESCVRAANQEILGDCKKKFGVSVMASERGTERLERGRRQNSYQKDTGKSGVHSLILKQRRIVVLFC